MGKTFEWMEKCIVSEVHLLVKNKLEDKSMKSINSPPIIKEFVK